MLARTDCGCIGDNCTIQLSTPKKVNKEMFNVAEISPEHTKWGLFTDETNNLGITVLQIQHHDQQSLQTKLSKSVFAAVVDFPLFDNLTVPAARSCFIIRLERCQRSTVAAFITQRSTVAAGHH